MTRETVDPVRDVLQHVIDLMPFEREESLTEPLLSEVIVLVSAGHLIDWEFEYADGEALRRCVPIPAKADRDEIPNRGSESRIH